MRRPVQCNYPYREKMELFGFTPSGMSVLRHQSYGTKRIYFFIGLEIGFLLNLKGIFLTNI